MNFRTEQRRSGPPYQNKTLSPHCATDKNEKQFDNSPLLYYKLSTNNQKK